MAIVFQRGGVQCLALEVLNFGVWKTLAECAECSANEKEGSELLHTINEKSGEQTPSGL
jgi:hypothetical protein